MAVTRLVLTDFRNHRDAVLAAGPGFVVLTGENGAGKTNVLEALSLLTPGRGLRRAPLSEMVRQGATGGFGDSLRRGERRIEDNRPLTLLTRPRCHHALRSSAEWPV